VTDRGKEIVKKVVVRIAEVAPQGLGRWDRAWDLIEEPSNAFLDALAVWERSDTADTRRRLQSAADEFVRAWRCAAEEWVEDKRTQQPDHTVGAWESGG